MNFYNMMARAKTSNLERDKNRSFDTNKGKRYESLAFPAFYGSPIRTDSFVVVWIVSVFRLFTYAEVRIIDHKTGWYRRW